MQGNVSLLLLFVLVALLFSIGNAHASSVTASFNTINSTVGINQDVFFNLSGYFPQNVSYTIYLGSKAVLSGSIPANNVQSYMLKYNVTNTEYGGYPSKITFSALTTPLISNTEVTILPAPGFGFLPNLNYAYAFNRSETINNITNKVLEASMTISLFDSGNTPLNVTWLLPTENDISFSLDYVESFGLVPGQELNIPINLTLAKRTSQAINFSFLGSFGTESLRRNYIVTLLSPIINMSFLNGAVHPINANKSEFSTNIVNGNNAQINATFSFLLEINGGMVVYNTSKLIYPSTTSLSFVIPNAKVVNVTAFYLSQNGTVTTESVYYSPLSKTPAPAASVLASYGYFIIFASAIAVLVIIHLRARKGGKTGEKKKI